MHNMHMEVICKICKIICKIICRICNQYADIVHIAICCIYVSHHMLHICITLIYAQYVLYTQYIIQKHNMQNMSKHAYTAYLTYYVYILCRTMLSWKPCDFIGPTTTRVTLFCTRHSLSGTHNTRVICASSHGHLCQRNCKRPTAKTWYLSARLGSLTVLFSSGWITSGSANFCSCSKSIR